jgi:hypothetical protein
MDARRANLHADFVDGDLLVVDEGVGASHLAARLEEETIGKVPKERSVED